MSTWSSVSSGWKHVKRKMHPWPELDRPTKQKLADPWACLTWLDQQNCFFFLTFKKKYHILWQLFLIVPPKVQIVCVHLLIHRIREALLSSVEHGHSREDDFTNICSRRNIFCRSQPFHFASSDCTCQPGSFVSFSIFSANDYNF